MSLISKLKYILFTTILLLQFTFQTIAVSNKSRGALANPKPIIVEQANGEKITLFLKGDALVHWYETTDGYTVLKSKNNNFEYAISNSNGDIVPSGVAVSNSNLKSISTINKTRNLFSETQIEVKKKHYFNQFSTPSTLDSDSFPTTGVNNVLVILAEFKDEKFSISESRFDSILNAINYNGTGSFKDYYKINSHGKLELNSTVTQWVTLPNTKAFYGANEGNGNDKNPKSLARDAIDEAEKLGIDFSKFDNNKNGQVDGVVIIHAGYGEEAGSDEDNIWSHRWYLDHLKVEYDNVLVYDYAIFPELESNSGKSPITIGVICHEFGHILGLPDFYDTDYEGSGGKAFDLGTWDLMAGGSWNNNGKTPAGINAYGKHFLKWIEVNELTEKGFFVMKNSISDDIAYKINTKTANEYYILENRQQTSIDSFIPHHGLIIYHVDGNLIKKNDQLINVNPEHQGFDIVEADGIPTISTITGDPFPGTNNVKHFTDNTTPNSKSWLSQASEMPINFITEYTNGNISFYANYSESELNQLNTVTVYVNNGKKPLINATVSLGELSIYTDSKGSASFILPDTANIQYTVSANTYSIFDGTINEINKNEIVFVTLTPTGVKMVQNDVHIYPNPFFNTIYLSGNWMDYSNYTILNTTGQKLSQGKITENSIDLNFLPEGLYTILLHSTNQHTKKQLIIKR